MRQCVQFQRLFLCEPFQTLQTLEIPDAFMTEFMPPEVRFGCEFVIAGHTLVRLFSTVDSGVNCKQKKTAVARIFDTFWWSSLLTFFDDPPISGPSSFHTRMLETLFRFSHKNGSVYPIELLSVLLFHTYQSHLTCSPELCHKWSTRTFRLPRT